MPDLPSTYFKGAIWISLPFHLMGAGVIFIILKTDLVSITTPEWIGIAMGVMFFNAGFVVGLLDTGFNKVRKNLWFAYFHGFALISIILIFTALLNWVAFGPGEREFSGGISIPFIAFSFGRANEFMGAFSLEYQPCYLILLSAAQYI